MNSLISSDQCFAKELSGEHLYRLVAFTCDGLQITGTIEDVQHSTATPELVYVTVTLGKVSTRSFMAAVPPDTYIRLNP